MTEYIPAETGEYTSDNPQLSIPARCEKYLKDNEHNTPYLTLKICWDICFKFDHCLFHKAYSLSPSFAVGKLFAFQNR